MTTSSKEDLSKWVRVNDYYDVYADKLIIGQSLGVRITKHKNPKYYYLAAAAFMETQEINRFIQTSMPYGNFDDNHTVNKLFTPLTTDEFNTKQNVVWRTYEYKDNISTIRIEKTPASAAIAVAIATAPSSAYFNVTVTVYITDEDLAGRASTIYRSIATLLGFADALSRQRRQASFVGCILDVNQCLSKHLGILELSKIVFEYLFA